jgi:protein subunit release factor A
MKNSIRHRIEVQAERWEELGRALAEPSLEGGSTQFREASVEYSRLTPLAELWRTFLGHEQELEAVRALAADADADMRELGSEEATRLVAALQADEQEHKATALAEGAERAPAYPLMSALVRMGCRTAIAVSKHI